MGSTSLPATLGVTEMSESDTAMLEVVELLELMLTPAGDEWDVDLSEFGE